MTAAAVAAAIFLAAQGCALPDPPREVTITEATWQKIQGRLGVAHLHALYHPGDEYVGPIYAIRDIAATSDPTYRASLHVHELAHGICPRADPCTAFAMQDNFLEQHGDSVRNHLAHPTEGGVDCRRSVR